MPQIQNHCVDCQREIKLQIGQAVINRALRWHTSYMCPFCGAAVEADDIGFPPDEIRQLILSKEGKWYLVIEESESKRAAAVKILHQALDLSLAEAGRLLKCFPDPLISGTKAEMMWLKELLATDGLQAAVVMQNEDG